MSIGFSLEGTKSCGYSFGAPSSRRGAAASESRVSRQLSLEQETRDERRHHGHDYDQDPDLTTCTLDIAGMTCASCVRRVEKAFGKLPGVSAAQVNLATEAATVTYDPAAVTADELTAAVGAAGYTGLLRSGDEPPASTPSLAPPDETADTGGRDNGELTRLKRKWQVALTTGLGLMVLMYLPLSIDAMDWLMPVILVLATVVQFWAGRGIDAAAWAAARHRATNMNTLVAGSIS